MKRVVCLLVAVGAIVAGVGLPLIGASSNERPCGVESADIIDGGALYEAATETTPSKLTFRITTGGASCPLLSYQVKVWDDDNPASPLLAQASVRGDGVAENPDETDFVFVSFTGIPQGDSIFCFVGKTSSGPLFDRAPDTGRFCFDTSGGGSGAGHFR